MKYETLKTSCVDLFCLQDVRWTGQGAKRLQMVSNFFGVGVVKQKTGVGVIVANWLIGS